MTQEHPITPPPELVQQWYDNMGPDPGPFESFANAAARWGADQELLACGNYLEKCAAWEPEDVTEFYNYRRPRPKPPSLKEQALAALDDAIMRGDCITISDALPTIRRALEKLDD